MENGAHDGAGATSTLAPTSVMLCDHYESSRLSLSAALQNLPFVNLVSEHSSLSSVTRAWGADAPEILLLNLHPAARVVDGIMLASLKDLSPETHCILLSSLDDNDAHGHADALGVHELVAKSVNLRALEDSIRRQARA